MSSIENTDTLNALVKRLELLRPDSERLWGTMTAAEMLCHLGDATDSVLRIGAVEARRGIGERVRGKPFVKLMALYLPVSWPKGLPTSDRVDPRKDGTQPTEFEADRRRVIEGLRSFATGTENAYPQSHDAFGRMSRKDWMRWAYRHTDHHLRQFGL